MIDANKKEISVFPNATTVLELLYYNKLPMSVVLNTTIPDEVNYVLKLFDWDRYFQCKQFYPGTYNIHIKK